MASVSLVSDRTVEPQLQTGLQSGIGPAASRDNRPLLDASSTLKVQGPAGSQRSSVRDSSEHTNVPSDVNEDRISSLSGSQENNRPALSAENAAWQKKYILTLGKKGL